jgi:hypothetical protein
LLQCGQNNVASLCATAQDQHATGTAESRTFNMKYSRAENEN